MYVTRVKMKNARKYAYSNSRIHAKVSMMLNKETFQQVSGAKGTSAVLAVLMQTDYKDDIEYYGGLGIKPELLDFALNRNLARNVGLLIKIAPKDAKNILSMITKGWGVENIKLALEAKVQGIPFANVSKYVIDTEDMGSKEIEVAMAEASAEQMIRKLMEVRSYRLMLVELEKGIRNGIPIPAAEYRMEIAYLKFFQDCVKKIGKMDVDAKSIIEMEIKRRNIMMALRAKRRGLSGDKFSELLIGEESPDARKLAKIYGDAKDVESLAGSINDFSLDGMIELYRKKRQLVLFDIHMRNIILKNWMKMLKRSMLSIGTLIAYANAKELEVLRLRDVIKTREYQIATNLSDDILNS
jgi:vacuolar-type H+-ATPase subunit C/Vma6